MVRLRRVRAATTSCAACCTRAVRRDPVAVRAVRHRRPRGTGRRGAPRGGRERRPGRGARRAPVPACSTRRATPAPWPRPSSGCSTSPAYRASQAAGTRWSRRSTAGTRSPPTTATRSTADAGARPKTTGPSRRLRLRLKVVKALRSFTVRPRLPDRSLPLERLAMNLRWSWDERTRDLFRWVDSRRVWDATRPRPGRRSSALVDATALLDALADDPRLPALPRRDRRRAQPLPHPAAAGSSEARRAPARRASSSPTSRPSSASPRRSRSTPAASACWPATT